MTPILSILLQLAHSLFALTAHLKDGICDLLSNKYFLATQLSSIFKMGLFNKRTVTKLFYSLL